MAYNNEKLENVCRTLKAKGVYGGTVDELKRYLDAKPENFDNFLKTLKDKNIYGGTAEELSRYIGYTAPTATTTTTTATPAPTAVGGVQQPQEEKGFWNWAYGVFKNSTPGVTGEGNAHAEIIKEWHEDDAIKATRENYTADPYRDDAAYIAQNDEDIRNGKYTLKEEKTDEDIRENQLALYNATPEGKAEYDKMNTACSQKQNEYFERFSKTVEYDKLMKEYQSAYNAAVGDSAKEEVEKRYNALLNDKLVAYGGEEYEKALEDIYSKYYEKARTARQNSWEGAETRLWQPITDSLANETLKKVNEELTKPRVVKYKDKDGNSAEYEYPSFQDYFGHRNVDDIRKYAEREKALRLRGDGDTSSWGEDFFVLKTAQSSLEETQKLIDAAKKYDERNMFENLGQGVWDKLSSGETWGVGFAAVIGDNTTKKLVEKADRGEKLTENEELLMDALAIELYTHAFYDYKIGHAYKAGQVTGESIPFMIEMALSPFSGVGRAVAKKVAMWGLRRGFAKGAVTTLKVGARFGGEMLGAAGKTVFMDADAVARGVTQRMTGDINTQFEYNKELGTYKAKYNGRENMQGAGEALWNSGVSQFNENFSEVVFTPFKGLGIGRKIFKKIPVGGKFLSEDAKKSFGKFYDGIQRAKERFKIGSYGEEGGEEEVNNAFNVLFTTDTKAEDVFNEEAQIDTWLGLLPMQVAFGLLGGGAKVGHKAYGKYQKWHANRKADNNWKEWLDKQPEADRNFYNMLQERLDAGDIEVEGDVKNYIRKVLADPKTKHSEKEEKLQALAAQLYDKQSDDFQKVIHDYYGKNFDDGRGEYRNAQDPSKIIYCSVKDYQANTYRRNVDGSFYFIDLGENGNTDERGVPMHNIDDGHNGEIIEMPADAIVQEGAIDYDEAREKYINHTQAVAVAHNRFEEGDKIVSEELPGMRNTIKRFDSDGVVLESEDMNGAKSETKISYEELVDYYQTAEDKQMEDASDKIDEQSNTSNGHVTNVKIGGSEGTFYVKSGNLVVSTDKDGNPVIDKEKSDGTFVVVNSETGEAKQIGIDQIEAVLGDAHKSEMKAQADENIRQAAYNAKHYPEGSIIYNTNTPEIGLTTVVSTDANGITYISRNEQTGEVEQSVITNDQRGQWAVLNFEEGDVLQTQMHTYEIVSHDASNKLYTVRIDGAEETEGVSSQELADILTSEQFDTAAFVKSKQAAEEQADNEQADNEQADTNNEQTEDTTQEGQQEITNEQGENGAPQIGEGGSETTPETTTEEQDEFSEYSDADIAATLEDIKKQLQKQQEIALKPISLIDDKAKAKRAKAQEEIKRLQELYDKFNAVYAQRMQAAEAKRAEEKAAAEKAAQEAAAAKKEAEEAARLEAEKKAGGVPDVSRDSAAAARKRGYRMVNGNVVKRQENTQGVYGKEVEIMFSTQDKPKGRVKVIDASQLQPSHKGGQRNHSYFITEAQPKERTDKASQVAAQKIAENINPQQITEGATAYTGAPVTNTRGEVIQGNNRSIALLMMYDSYPDQAAKYKQYLIDNAERFGLNAEEVAAMQNPVLVTELDVTDEEAIRLGQKNAQDTESGGKQTIDAAKTAQMLGDGLASFARRLTTTDDEEMTLSEMIAANGGEAIKFLRQKDIINDTQYQTAFNDKGELTDEAKNSLLDILRNLLFANAKVDNIREMFARLPLTAQKAILQTVARDANSPADAKVVPYLQEAIEVFYDLQSDPTFMAAKTYEERMAAIWAWSKQLQMDFVSGSFLPAEKFSNFAFALAATFKSQTMATQRAAFNELYNKLQGEGGDLFNATETLTLEQAVEQIYHIKLNNQQNNVTNDGSPVLGNSSKTGGSGQLGENGGTGGAKPLEGGTQSTNNRGGVGGNNQKGEGTTEKPLTPSSIAPTKRSAKEKREDQQITTANEKAKDSSVVLARHMDNGDKVVWRRKQKVKDNGERLIYVERERNGKITSEKDAGVGFPISEISDEFELSDEAKEQLEEFKEDGVDYDIQITEVRISADGRSAGASCIFIDKNDPTNKFRGDIKLTPTEKGKEEATGDKHSTNNEGEKSENKIFTEDAYEAARRRMHERLNRLNAGLDPEMLSDGLIMAGYHVEKGARKFADFAKRMIEEFGDKIRPYLKAFYNGLRDLPEAEELSKEMDDYATVAQFDVKSITLEEPKAPENTAPAQFKVGDKIHYTTANGRKTIEATIEDVNSDGTYNIKYEAMPFMPTTAFNIPANQLQPLDKPKEQESKTNGFIEEFRKLKEKYPDTLLLFRAGDFFEVYGEDAVDISKILGITLTHRNVDDRQIERAGFPFHSIDVYLPKLVQAGKRVAFNEPILREDNEANVLSSRYREDEIKTAEKLLKKLQSEEKNVPLRETEKRYECNGKSVVVDKADYKTYLTDEAKALFTELSKQGEKPLAVPTSAYISYASIDGVKIPAEVLLQDPNIQAAQAKIDTRSGQSLELTDEQIKEYAMRLLDAEHGSAVLNAKGKINKRNGEEDFSGEVAQEHKALFVIGRPAGGKSSVYANPLSAQNKARIIDSDVVKPWLDGFDGGDGAGYVQEASARVADTALQIAMQRGDNMVIPKIGGGSIIKMAADLRQAGYSVELYYNEVSEGSSIMRASARFAETGRYLSIGYLQSIKNKAEKTFTNYANKTIKEVQDEKPELFMSAGQTNVGGLGQNALGRGKEISSGDYFFSKAEWKNNDVEFGQPTKLVWSSESDEPIPGTDSARAHQQIGEVHKSTHTKTGEDIWVVKPANRVSDAEFKLLKDRAKKHNGYYSSFVKNRGFIFKSEEDANKFNLINDEEITTDQTSADTEAACNAGEIAAGEAAAITRDRPDSSGAEREPSGESIEGGLRESKQIDFTHEQADKEIVVRQQAVVKIDKADDKVVNQLAVLGYYEVDTSDPSKHNEVYGYGKTAEAKAVKDIDRLAKQLASDLGIEISQRKVIAKANIASAGGDISARLPLENGKELYLSVSIEPNNSNYFSQDYSEDALVADHMYWRIEDPQNSGMSRYLTPNYNFGMYEKGALKTTYGELLQDIRKCGKDYLPNVTAEMTLQEVVKKATEQTNHKKNNKNSISSNQQMLDLFSDVTDTLNEEAKQEAMTEIPPQENNLHRGFKIGDTIRHKKYGDVHIVDFERDGRPVIDSFGANWITEIANWSDIDLTNSNTNNTSNDGRTEVRTDGRGEGSTAQTEPSGQSGNENGPLGGSQQLQDERPVSGRVGTSGTSHRVHDGERSEGTPLQSTKQTVNAEPIDSGESSKWHNTRNFSAKGNEHLAPTTPKARYEANLAAIRLLKQLQEEDRQATPQEMEVLSKYSGWGGLGEYFQGEPGTTYYSQHGERSPYQVLASILTPEELEAAQLSRNSAYYTPESVINTMWQIAERLGFKGGNILEGSAGIGNIFALMPSSISHKSNLTAVEIDDITAGILAQLYPDATTHHAGFQDVEIPNNSQDLVITNVPFVTGLRVHDKQEKDLSKRFGNIHDFCIAKNVRKLKQGGLGIFITASNTLDKSKDLRLWLDNEGNADVIGAFRLNNETFGGTNATSDIIVVRKRINSQKDPRAINVLDTSTGRVATQQQDEVWDKKERRYIRPEGKEFKVVYNDYFVQHPDKMGGVMEFAFERGVKWREMALGCYPSADSNQADLLAKWVESLDKVDNLQTKEEQFQYAPIGDYEDVASNIPYGSLVANSKGEICAVQAGKAVPIEGINSQKVKGQPKAQVLNDYIAIKQAISHLLEAQKKDISDAELKPYLQLLNKVYDGFVRKYGSLNRNVSISFLRNDIEWASIAAIEKVSETVNPDGKKKVEVRKTDLFNKRVIGIQASPKAENVKDGVILSIQQFGTIRTDNISEWLGKPIDEIEKEILDTRLGFRNPQTGGIEVRHQYLSGNVREKLAYAEEHNADGSLNANIEELRKVIPIDIPAHLIEINLGSTWIPIELYKQYAKEKYDIDLELNHVASSWVANQIWRMGEQDRSGGVYSQEIDKQIYGHELMVAAMNNVPIVVSKVVTHYGGSTETITDKKATAACSDKISQIKDDFTEWARGKMQQDDNLADRVQKIYNERFNAVVPMLKVDDIFLSKHLPGQNSAKYSLYPHQQQAVARGLTQPLMLAHEVGTGKTISLISTAMEMRRLGTAKKPMIVVQNATTKQFVADAKDLYPNAKILTVSDKDRTAEGRQEFYAKIKYNDWDLIIIPQSVFDMIPDSESRMQDFIKEKIDEKIHAIEAAKQAGVDSKVTDRMERELVALQGDFEDNNMSGKHTTKKSKDGKKEAEKRANAEARAKEMLDRKTDSVANFDEMGIDALLIDEAHNYKHLGFATMMQRGVKGVDPSYSKRAAALFLKCQAVYEKTGHKNVIFATGTPISNTAAEIWTFMKYLMPKVMLKENDIYYFDDFVHNFGKINEQAEFATNGKYKVNNRFAQYNNVPELMRLWLTVADCVLTREVGQVNDKVPELEGGKAQDIFLEQSPSLIDIMAAVRAKLDEFEQMSGAEKKENSHIPLTMYGIAKRAAIDPRLVDEFAEDEPLSKTNRAVSEVLRSLNDSKRYNGTVAIFCDSYQNKKSGFNLFEDIKDKLVDQGVLANQIAIIRSEMTDTAKQKIFDAVREGDIRVIMGSTQTLGTGVNIQTRLHTLIHMDAPDRPMDYTQRNGRILRQGNMHKEWGIPVRVLRFGVKGTLDVTSYQRLKTKAGFIDSIMNGKSMIDNNLENRVIDDADEGVFDNMLAVISGSQYAILQQQAQRDLRKWEAREQQYRIDQILIANKTKNNDLIIGHRKQLIEQSKKLIEEYQKVFPNGKVNEYNVDGTICRTQDALKTALKALNKQIAAESETLRADNWGDKKFLSYNISFNGVPFNISIHLVRKIDYKDGKTVRTIGKELFYSSPLLGENAIPSDTKVIDRLIEEIQTNILTGKQAEGTITYSQNYIERLQKDNDLMRAREGKPFEHQAELEKARALFNEYTQKMEAELKAQQEEYASKAHEIVNLDKMDSEDDATDDTTETQFQLDTLDYDENLTPTQKRATEYLFNALKNAGVEVELISQAQAQAQHRRALMRAFSQGKALQLSGKIYGYAWGGKIYLTPEGLTPNAQIHEYTHLWDNACQQVNPELWKRGVELMKQTPLWDKIKKDPRYANLKTDDQIASEAHSRLTGKDGAAIMEQMAKAAETKGLASMVKELGLVGMLKKWLSDFWHWTKDTFAPWTKEEAAQVSIDDFVRMPLADLVKGVNPNAFGVDEKGTRFQIIGEQGAANLDKAEEAEEIENQDKRFNDELDEFKNKHHHGLLHLGSPSPILKVCGVNVSEITLSPSVLQSHLKKHGLDTDDLKGLVKSMREPILIYKHGLNAPNIIIVTELNVKGGKLSASLKLDSNGEVVEISNISSIHSKNAETELNRFYKMGEKGFREALKWVNKQKVLQWITPRTYKSSDMQTNEVPFDVAKVVQNFENPKLPEENFDESADDIRFSIETDEEFENEFGMEEAKSEPIPFENVVGTMKPDEGLREYASRMNAVMNGYSEERMQQIAELVNKRMERGGKWYAKLYRHLYDKYYPLDRFQKALAEQGALLDQRTDAYSDIFRSMGRATTQFQKFYDERFKPLTTLLRSLIESKAVKDFKDVRWADKKTMSERDKITLYLRAKDMVECEEKGLVERGAAGFADFVRHADNALQGWTPQEYVAAFEAAIGEENVSRLWERVNAVNKFSLDYMQEHGFVDEKLVERYKEREFYVPQRGFEEGESHVDLNALRKAEGRKSLSADPLPFMAGIAEQTIMSVEKNRTKQKMLQFAIANMRLGKETGTFDVAKVQYRKTGHILENGLPEYEAVYDGIPQEDLQRDAHYRREIIRIREFLKDKNLTDEQYYDYLDKIEELEDKIQYASSVRYDQIRPEIPEKINQNRVDVWQNGKHYSLLFADRAVADALNRKDGEMGRFVRFLNTAIPFVQRLTQYFSRILTQQNPAFALWNLLRDTGLGFHTNLLEHPTWVGAYSKNLARVQKAVARYAFAGKYADSNIGKYLQEYFNEGAQTGFSFVNGIEDLQRQISRELKRGNKLDAFVNSNFNPLQLFSNITEWSELTVRVAQYVTAREHGYTPEQAATEAKEVSTNFDRRGNLRLCYNFYSFFNAAMQGTNKHIRQVMNGHGKGLAISLALLMGAGLLNALLTPDDPDDEMGYTEFDRMQNICLGRIRIPLPPGLRAFWALGVQAALAMQGRKTWNAALVDGATFLFSEIMPINIMGGFDVSESTNRLEFESKLAFREFIPTGLQPLYDLANNTTFNGSTVYREPYLRSQDGKIPQTMLGKRNVNGLIKLSTDKLFELGGGDLSEKTLTKSDGTQVSGFFDVNPSKVEYLIKSATGGIGQFAVDLFNTGYNAFTDNINSFDDFAATMPVIKRAWKPYKEEKEAVRDFYILKGRIEAAKKAEGTMPRERKKILREAERAIAPLDRKGRSPEKATKEQLMKMHNIIIKWNENYW